MGEKNPQHILQASIGISLPAWISFCGEKRKNSFSRVIINSKFTYWNNYNQNRSAHSFTWITLSFTSFQDRKKKKKNTEECINTLPPPPPKSAKCPSLLKSLAIQAVTLKCTQNSCSLIQRNEQEYFQLCNLKCIWLWRNIPIYSIS